MIGAIVHVETQLAGANLAGDHAAGATTLNVIYGWDFPAGGGQLSIAGAVYDYTAATYPLESDDDPTVLTLAEPLASAAADGEFVKVEPEAADKFAEVKLGEYGETIVARVAQPLIDKIRTGVRGDLAAAETVIVEPDGNSWVLQDVVGRQLPTDPRNLDPGVELPPQMIPAESWQQYAALYAENLVFRYLQGKIAVMEELWLAKYASDVAGEITPAPGSNIIRLSVEDGFQMMEPTGEIDAQGQPVYEYTLTFPMQKYDKDGNRQIADFAGEVHSRNGKFDEFTLQGNASTGLRGHVGPDAEFQLDQRVQDPTEQTTVQLGALETKWPTANDFTEIGWGTHSGFVVQARWNAAGNKYVIARFIDPATGTVDHTVDLLPFSQVGGFTAGGGNLYTLAKFRAEDVWTITKWSPSGLNLGSTVVAVESSRVVALGYDGGQVLLLGLGGTVSDIRRYNPDTMNRQDSINLPALDTTKRAVGVGQDWIAYGNEFGWLSGTGLTRGVEAAGTSGRGWWSYCGAMSGAGKLPDGQFAATNESGVLYRYNSERPNGGVTLWSTWTKKDSATGRETVMATPSAFTWSTRSYATIACPLPAGPNDVELYASTVSKNRADMRLIPGMGIGKNQATISTAPTTGVSPPATSGFLDGSGSLPGRIVSQARYGINNYPLLDFDGAGNLKALKAFQSGHVDINVPALTTNYSATVTFAAPFLAAPSVNISIGAVPSGPTADPQQFAIPTVDAVSTTGFTARVRRTGGTVGNNNVRLYWQAIAKTQ